MDIHELIGFYHTARLSSVSQAACFLELGQPTVTAHLQRLEQDIGAEYQVGLEMDNSELVRKYVGIGMGIAVTTTELFGPIHEDGSRLRILELSHLLPSVQIGVAVEARLDLSAGAWEFIADLKAAAVGAQPLSAKLSRAAKS